MSSLETDDRDFETLLNYIKRSRGFDFTGYKRPSLKRRVQKRMNDVGVDKFDSYLDYLEVHPDEFAQLFNTVLINVTSFFRDQDAWDFLSNQLAARFTASKNNEPIRAWSAGCASGEEPYSLAIVLAELLGLSEVMRRVKIYATDVDENALNQARRATYSESALEAVPDELRQKYFSKTEHGYSLIQELRRTVIFGRHDVVQDAPIPRLDLLLCRNVLMYFNAETQGKVLARLYYALKPDGILFLGKAEMLLTRSTLFRPLELRHRLFMKVPAVLPTTENRLEPSSDGLPLQSEGLFEISHEYFWNSPDAGLIVGADGLLQSYNERARDLFGLSQRDLGKHVKELETSYRPSDLQQLVVRCCTEKAAVLGEKITRGTTSARKQCTRAHLWPLPRDLGEVRAIAIRFEDLSASEKLIEDLQQTTAELETANDELQSAREELETTNEELQSSNEELETTNEELQSTNEELETMNEELQSTNTELETTNQELRRLYDELTNSNAFLESILASIRSAVIVIDRNLRILHWSEHATNLWGLRADEVTGRTIEELDIGLKQDELLPSIKQVLHQQREFVEFSVPATNRRGAKIRCTIKLAKRASAAKEPIGVVILLDEEPASNH